MGEIGGRNGASSGFGGLGGLAGRVTTLTANVKQLGRWTPAGAPKKRPPGRSAKARAKVQPASRWSRFKWIGIGVVAGIVLTAAVAVSINGLEARVSWGGISALWSKPEPKPVPKPEVADITAGVLSGCVKGATTGALGVLAPATTLVATGAFAPVSVAVVATASGVGCGIGAVGNVAGDRIATMWTSVWSGVGGLFGSR
jgi:hypothetical protein